MPTSDRVLAALTKAKGAAQMANRKNADPKAAIAELSTAVEALAGAIDQMYRASLKTPNE